MHGDKTLLEILIKMKKMKM